MFKKQNLLAAMMLASTSAYSLPIDWHGAFGVDSSILNNYRRVKAKTNNVPVTTNSGSQEVALTDGSKQNASFQSYVFRLNPTLIVNDSATFKAELTSGYGRGGRVGENDQKSKKGGQVPYHYTTTSDNQLNINKLYMELYADSATYVIGRHSADWALGAVQNSGDNLWDRHSFIRDGITAKLKIGNFFINPYFARISSDGSLTRSHRTKETGITLLYDNIDNDMAFGVLYGVKTSSSYSEKSVNGPAGVTLGQTDVKVTDFYFRKKFSDLSFELEVPLFSGELGHYLTTTGNTKYKAQAILFSSNYKLSDTWSVGFDAGQVSGQGATTSSFEAAYLNPNFQVANLLFRYNMHAVTDDSQSLYDSYVTNAMYGKVKAQYKNEKWTWDTAIIWAKANEVAQKGETFFNHQTQTLVNSANANQSDDLGMEIDLSFKYQWNEAVEVGVNTAYLFTGDYWSFTNDANVKNEASNSYLLQANVGMKF